MTAKRNFKRRVRQRQARTGESYVTARRQLLASHPAAGAPTDRKAGDAEQTLPGAAPATSPSAEAAAAEPVRVALAAGDPVRVIDGPFGGFTATVEAIDANHHKVTVSVRVAGQAMSIELDVDEVECAAPTAAIPDGAGAEAEGAEPAAGLSVVELRDVSDQARRVGLVCPILMFPSLAERVPPGRVLARLRNLLVATIEDPALGVMSGLALTGQKPRPRKRSQLDIETVRRFVQRANAGLGSVSDDGAILAFHVTDGDSMLPVLCALGAQETALVLSALDDLTTGPWGPIGELLAPPRLSKIASSRVGLPGPPRLPGPRLFVIHDGRRHLVASNQFVIGRSPMTADLAIKNGNVSRKHAAVIARNGAHYLKDLGSTNGITYKGMRIDNKRIEEGDVFQIGDDEIRFTYRPE